MPPRICQNFLPHGLASFRPAFVQSRSAQNATKAAPTEQALRIWTVTWNMGNAKPADQLHVGSI